jgi:hypothetical protein
MAFQLGRIRNRYFHQDATLPAAETIAFAFKAQALMKGTGFSPSINHLQLRAALAAEGWPFHSVGFATDISIRTRRYPLQKQSHLLSRRKP